MQNTRTDNRVGVDSNSSFGVFLRRPSLPSLQHHCMQLSLLIGLASPVSAFLPQRQGMAGGMLLPSPISHVLNLPKSPTRHWQQDSDGGAAACLRPLSWRWPGPRWACIDDLFYQSMSMLSLCHVLERCPATQQINGQHDVQLNVITMTNTPLAAPPTLRGCHAAGHQMCLLG